MDGASRTNGLNLYCVVNTHGSSALRNFPLGNRGRRSRRAERGLLRRLTGDWTRNTRWLTLRRRVWVCSRSGSGWSSSSRRGVYRNVQKWKRRSESSLRKVLKMSFNESWFQAIYRDVGSSIRELKAEELFFSIQDFKRSIVFWTKGRMYTIITDEHMCARLQVFRNVGMNLLSSWRCRFPRGRRSMQSG